MSKDYFYRCIDSVTDKISQLPNSSHIKKHFTDKRIKEISEKIENNDCKNLEWGYWQPLYLFLKNTKISAIKALDEDIDIVINKTQKSLIAKQLDFLNDNRENGSSWTAGLFEMADSKVKCNTQNTSKVCTWKLPQSAINSFSLKSESRSAV